MQVVLLLALLIAAPFAIVRTWQWVTGAPPERAARDRATLHASYPLGYALFAVEGTQLHRLHGPQPAPEVRVDWSATTLLSAIPTSVILRPPDVVAPDRTPVTAEPIRLPRIAGFRRPYLRGGGIEGVAEVLEADASGFTCVLGLRDKTDDPRR